MNRGLLNIFPSFIINFYFQHHNYPSITPPFPFPPFSFVPPAQVKKRGRLSLGFSLDLSSELGSSKKRSEGAIERGASNYVPESLSERHRKTSGGDGVRVNCSFRLEKTNPIIQGNECGAIKRDNRGSRMPLGFDFDSASNRTEPLKASKFKLRYIRF